MLEVRKLEVVYHHVSTAIQGVSITVKEENVFAVIGVNGAGKTTTLRAVSGFLGIDHAMITDGEIKVVGVNYFRAPDLKLPDVVVHEYDDKIAQQMYEKLAKLRQRRDNEKAKKAISALVEACKNGKNVMEYTVECARADVTEGEMRRAFTEAFGFWKPPMSI